MTLLNKLFLKPKFSFEDQKKQLSEARIKELIKLEMKRRDETIRDFNRSALYRYLDQHD